MKYTENGYTLLIETNDFNSAKESINDIKNALMQNAVFFNDIDCYHWQYDTKLPCGKWLENIRLSNDFKTVSATLLF